MCGELEEGTCDICKKTGVVVSRKYFRYNLHCDCCNGTTHFEIVRYCESCNPKRPKKITILPHSDTYVNN